MILIILGVSLVYGVLFTKSGNEYIASYIKEKIDNKDKNIFLTINKFELTTSNLIFDAFINDNSLVKIDGAISIFGANTDLKYEIKIKNLENLEKLLNQKLSGELNTNGKIKTDGDITLVEGKSDIAKSETYYNLGLEGLTLKNGTFLIKNAKVEELLGSFNQPKYISGLATIKGDIKSFEESNLDGKIDISYDKGLIQNSVVNKEFNQNLQTLIPLKSVINVLLNGENVEIKSNLISPIVEFFINKTIYNLNENQLKSDYKIEVKNLNVLEQIINKKLNGNLLTQGNVEYKNEILNVTGNSDIAMGKTKYEFVYENSKIHNLNFYGENIKIDKLLAMLNEPVFISGNLNIDGKIVSLDKESLDGSIKTKIDNGKSINEVLNTVYNQKLSDEVNFSLDIDSKLVPNQIISKVVNKSNLANLSMSEFIYDFKEKMFGGDYLLNILDLSKFNYLTSSKMSGSLDIGGKIKSKEGSLSIEGITKIAQGVVEFNLKNDNLSSSFKDISSKSLCLMLGYPQFFDSKVNGRVEYNLLLKKGDIDSTFEEGHFVENDFTKLINQFSKYDVLKDVFKNFNIKAKIDQKVLSSTFNLKNDNLEINALKSNIDFENHTIDANIKIKTKNKEFGIGILDSLDNPTVILDTKDFFKSKLDRTQQKIEDKLNSLLDKL